MIKLINTDFLFVDGTHEFKVMFPRDDRGKPSCITVLKDDKPLAVIDNSELIYLACSTHAHRIINQLTCADPKFALATYRQRALNRRGAGK